MKELFGTPMSSIAMGLGVLFVIIAAVVAYIAVRSPIVARMGVRNVPRRKTQTALIVVGLMLATAIMASAFTTGDSISYSIEGSVKDSLRTLDQVVRVDRDAPKWEGKPTPERFAAADVEAIVKALDSDPDVDGVLPVLTENVAAINVAGRHFEVNVMITGLDPARAATFEQLRLRDGRPVDLASLAPGEVYLDSKGAERLKAQAGTALGVPSGPGAIGRLTVKGIVDGYYFKRDETKAVLMLSLAEAQKFLSHPGEISYILISNKGDVDSGVERTAAVQQRIKDALATAGSQAREAEEHRAPLGDTGLEVFGLKADLIDLANLIATIFVSFFTTFGLFSIGVGILLIFLIFSMLAAERKSEMGMARAIGMKRGHLIRMFVMEGAVYSFGAAIVGAIVGMLVGWGLVAAVANAFAESSETEDFKLIFHATPRSVMVAFFIGIIVTFITVAIASWRISKLNIVRAIRDVPEPKLVKEGRRTLIWGIIFILLGLFIALNGWNARNIAGFRVGLSILPFGIANILRYRGVSSRAVWSAVGIVLMVYWLLPTKAVLFGRDDWNVDISIFFISGGMVVTGAVMALMNNADFILGAVMKSLGQFRRLAPIVKSAVSYPLRSAFRTGLSVAMFAVVVFSIVVMSTLTFSFEKLFDDTERIAGGYDVIAISQGEINPIADVSAAINGNPDLAFVTRVNGLPSVGGLRTILTAKAKLADGERELKNAILSGVDPNFIASNNFRIELATEDFKKGEGFDAPAVWETLQKRPGTALVNSLLVPTRANFGRQFLGDGFRLDPEGLYIENEVMDPVKVTVQDAKSGKSVELTVVGVVDDLASQFFMPFGIYASSETLQKAFERDIPLTSLFIHVSPGTPDAASRVEAAFFQNAMDTIDIAERIDESRAQNIAFNNLLTGFMALGLVVGVAALGVISARAVVERRKQIGVMRAIGFSRRMVQTTFLLESSFIALLGIAVGLILGLITSINVMTDVKENEPNVQLVIPWMRLVVIVVGSYLFSWLTTYLPARQAARVDPADALRFE